MAIDPSTPRWERAAGRWIPFSLLLVERTIQSDIIDMVDSRKVNAMFSAGLMMASVHQANMETLVVPFSIMLAACRLGAADALPALAPAAMYRDVDARAAEIVDAYQRHDTDAMHSFSAMTSGPQIADSQESR